MAPLRVLVLPVAREMDSRQFLNLGPLVPKRLSPNRPVEYLRANVGEASEVINNDGM